MATPVIGQDGVDSVSAALLRKAITSNGQLDNKLIYARVRYTGSSWEVVSSSSSSQLVSGNLAWSTNKLTVALTGYTAPPNVGATQSCVAIPYHPQAHATSSGNVDVQFWTMAGVLVTTQDTSMDIQLKIIGV